MREQPDLQLVQLAQAGDAEAYGQLFERYQSRIYNFAYSILGSAEDARDVTQDAFIRVFEALPGKTDLDFSPYVYRTARNLSYDVARARGRYIGDPETTLDTQVETGLDADPERTSLFAEQQAKVRAAVSALPTDYRAVLTLREIDEMSYQEIADSLGMPKNTVGVMISRARLKFRGAFRMQYVDANQLAEECKRMLPKLSAYIDGELKPAEVVVVEEHLDGCPLCRLAVDQMREASKSYRAFIPLIPPIALKANVFSHLGHLNGWPGASGAHGGPAGGQGGVESGGQPAGEPGGQSGSGPHDARAGTSDGGSAADGRGGGADAVEQGPGSSGESAGGTKLASLKKALSPKSPLLWFIIALSVAVIAVVGTGIATGWGQGEEPGTGQADDRPARSPSVIAVAASSSVEPTTLASSVASGGNAATATPTAEAAADTEAPDRPARTSPRDGALVSADQVTLRWHSVSDPSGVRYWVEIQQWIGGGEGWQELSTKSYSATHTHSSVPIKIRWRIWAIDGEGNRSAKSTWWTVVRAAEDDPPPEAPSTTPTGTPTRPYPGGGGFVIPDYPLR